MEQFKNEASGAKVAPRSILRIVNVRIDKNAVGGCLRFRLMVVDDDHVDAKFTKVSNRLVGISTAIESDKKLRDLTTKDPVNRIAAQSVAFIHPPRHRVAWL